MSWLLTYTRSFRAGNIPVPKHCSLRLYLSTRCSPLVISDEVAAAVQSRKPVVALETTIYTHGFPYPDNISLSSSLESLVRKHGGVPATIGIINGVAKVGMKAEEIIELLEKAGDPSTVKVSRRDLAFVCGTKRYYGGTTIAGTLVLAHLAGIKVFATGGLGGVHRDKPGETSMDISADLTELGRTPMALVSSGCKSFLDIPRTLEYLETQGVGVGTFADGREGPVKFPAFWTRESDFGSPNTIQDEKEAAAILHAQLKLPLTSGLLFANPIPAESSLPKEMMDKITLQAVNEAAEKGFKGSANTPYILSRIRDLANGGTIAANRVLVESNVVRGTKVAVELAKLESESTKQLDSEYKLSTIPSQSKVSSLHTVDVLVAGSIAIDLSCDYTPLGAYRSRLNPTMNTSNPSSITQSLGGVGRNVATASHYMGARTLLCSLLGGDAAGNTALSLLEKNGLPTSGIIFGPEGSRTAQYVAVNDAKKALVLAMADMKILETECEDFDQAWKPLLARHQPKWVVLDANWSAETLQQWIAASRRIGAKIAYEPVSMEKSGRLWRVHAGKDGTTDGNSVSGRDRLVDLATPNKSELDALVESLRASNMPQPRSFPNIRDIITQQRYSSEHFFDFETVLKATSLLPYIPCILTKFGPDGVLQTEALLSDDPRLEDADARHYIVFVPESGSHGASNGQRSTSPTITGIYIRHHPAKQTKNAEEIVSVNGVGDTFMGALVAILSRGMGTYPEEAIEMAQCAALMTLMSPESVNPKIKDIAGRVVPGIYGFEHLRRY